MLRQAEVFPKIPTFCLEVLRVVPDVLEHFAVLLGVHVLGALGEEVASEPAHGGEQNLAVNTCKGKRKGQKG